MPAVVIGQRLGRREDVKRAVPVSSIQLLVITPVLNPRMINIICTIFEEILFIIPQAFLMSCAATGEGVTSEGIVSGGKVDEGGKDGTNGEGGEDGTNGEGGDW